jgi:hypothetical protein
MDPPDPTFEFHKQQFKEMQSCPHLMCVVKAKNTKGRDCTLLCRIDEDATGNVKLVPVARMIDREYREHYEIAQIPLAA